MTQAVSSMSAADPISYRAALESVVRFDTSNYGRVRLRDRNRAELLQRLTTNDLVRLTPGQGARSVLINSHARILDLLTVYALPEHLLVVTSPGQGGTLTRYLQGRIFFQDKVVVEDLSADTIQLDLYGPQAAALIREATSVDPGDWSLHHIQAASIDSAQVWIARTLPIGGDGFSVFAQHSDAAIVERAFASAQPLAAATLDVLRIEQGYPAPRHELSTEYIPLETGLSDAVSFSKGCYVGQEIIARMDSRNRLAKRLMGLRLEQPVANGSVLLHEQKDAGLITSIAQSPRFGPIGLGYVRSAFAEPGTRLQVDSVGVELVELPFTSQE
jgi:tRNA-modifying protein YgfZ